MARDDTPRRPIPNRLIARLLPGRFLAAQLRRPSGRFGRWAMARALNDGNRDLIEATLDGLALAETEDFLDVGFGGGYGLRLASRSTSGALYGADFSPDMVVRAHGALVDLCRSGRLSLVTADVASLPFRDGLVHAIATTNTIYFWPDLGGALRELRRVVAPGGRVAFGYTGRDKMRGFSHITDHGFTKFAPEDLEGPLADAGFVEVQTRALSGAVTEGDFVTTAVRAG